MFSHFSRAPTCDKWTDTRRQLIPMQDTTEHHKRTLAYGKLHFIHQIRTTK